MIHGAKFEILKSVEHRQCKDLFHRGRKVITLSDELWDIIKVSPDHYIAFIRNLRERLI